MEKITVIRAEHFNAAHRLHNDNWSDEKNKAFFGKCNNPNYHGHNYDLEVMVNELLTKDQVKKKKTRRRGGKKTASSWLSPF